MVGRVVICEGPKAMMEAVRQRMENPDHPWARTLTDAAIICWPGGGNRHWDVDWSPLGRVPDGCEIIVVADNDEVGRKAASVIANRHLLHARHERLEPMAQREARRNDKVRVLTSLSRPPTS